MRLLAVNYSYTVEMTPLPTYNVNCGKPQSLKSGRGLPVVIPSEHRFVLAEDALSKLLLEDDIRDRAVIVVSVAGAFRKGKSFLLDFFLRYLDHTYNHGMGGDDWMGSEDEPLEGFSWRGGSERDTSGLLLWSQPFKATLPNGDKVLILLMDTQGTFDSESTVRDNATIFALSTMISSVQIYNLSQNIEEDDLQHLQLFTEYGRLALQNSVGKPFQHLQFLVRDWSFPYEHPFGPEGGQQLLDKWLEIHEGQHEELQTLRKHVVACFEKLACYLMPHPGLTVATNPHFKGKLSDISPEFKTHLRQFIPMLLSPEQLVPKTTGGQRVKARDLLLYFKAYMTIFNGSELPEPKSILEATAEANNLSAIAEAREVYDALMDEVAGGTRPYLQPKVLEQEHRRAKDKALHAFHSKRKMGGQELANTYSVQLVKELDELFEQLRAHNEGKNIFKMAITPAVLAVLMLLGYLLGVLGSGVGVQTLVAVGQVLTITAGAMLTLWGYSRITGNLRDVAVQIDEGAETVKNYLTQQAVGNATASTMGHSEDKKYS
ncbi:atlastin-like isoform X2 [Ostrinia furnacalis]|uniref:atlastin-like isoform X2 n=1 Tax=Ostrinia furnacalis TaxID=93504 RepID=UPI00103A68A3|nr:atlastin-like isoform X2 [Ostrinia furnacalis]